MNKWQKIKHYIPVHQHIVQQMITIEEFYQDWVFWKLWNEENIRSYIISNLIYHHMKQETQQVGFMIIGESYNGCYDQGSKKIC